MAQVYLSHLGRDPGNSHHAYHTQDACEYEWYNLPTAFYTAAMLRWTLPESEVRLLFPHVQGDWTHYGAKGILHVCRLHLNLDNASINSYSQPE